jgi:hypothetical protein
LKKELLLLSEYYYPDVSATGRLVTELAEDLVTLGMQVDVYCGYPSYLVQNEHDRDLPRRETHNGVEIYRFKYPNFNKNNTIGRLLNYFSFSLHNLLNLPSFRQYRTLFLLSNYDRHLCNISLTHAIRLDDVLVKFQVRSFSASLTSS